MMNRKEFLDRLAFLLQDIDEEERKSALEYYEAYFDDAGKDNEQQVISELGSPEQVAAIIKAGLDESFDQNIEYSETGMKNSRYKQNDTIIEAEIIDERKQDKNSHFKGNPDRNRILLIFIVIAAICLFAGIGTGIIPVLVGIFIAVIFFGIGIFIGGFACLIGAVACIIKGILVIGGFTGAGLITIAAGIGLIALALLFFMLDVLIIKLFPALIRFVVRLIRDIINYILRLLDRGGKTECEK